ncbi:hypothetical protein ACJ41O_006137 [Fusarium nematophilum]
MSQPETGNKATTPGQKNGEAEPSKPKGFKTYVLDCALLHRQRQDFRLVDKVGSEARCFAPADADPWFGFIIEFPLGKGQVANEASGFGVRHSLNKHLDDAVLPLDQHRIAVKFPRSEIQCIVKEAPESLLARFPDAKSKVMSLLTVCPSDEPLTINGFGMPFANPEDAEVAGWVNENKPIVEGLPLLDLFRQSHYHFVVPESVANATKHFSYSRLPPPFKYPYSNNQAWILPQYKKDIVANKGHQFAPAFSHPDDLSHMTAAIQAQVQDVMWLDDAAEEIAKTTFPAYFINPSSEDDTETKFFFVVVPLTKQFREEYEAAWRRLTKTEFFYLSLFDSHSDSKPTGSWECKIQAYPQGNDALNDHPTERHELVLYVRRPRKDDKPRKGIPRGYDFENCVALEFNAQLDDYERKVAAVLKFRPDALPSNVIGCGLPTAPHGGLLDGMNEDGTRLLREVEDRMDLHRALVRGTGFYDWMMRPAPMEVTDAIKAVTIGDAPPTLRPLPSTNFLDFGDEAYADAIVEEALPQDRPRFRGYLSNRPLGLGMITAGPGFGKTTAGAAAALAMEAKLGKILCSGPTNVAVDNLAARLDTRTRAVVQRYNQGKQQDDLARRRHKLVVRAYNPRDEFMALSRLLQSPHDADNALAKNSWRAPPKWKLHLSSAFWLLVVLRSPAVREIHPDDSKVLHELQKELDEREDVTPLRDLATGAITWEQFQGTAGTPSLIDKAESWMGAIIRGADLLCATPAGTEKFKQLSRWKNDLARGVAIDEAANMSRADLYCVWGNTLMPCFLFGDPKQLPPTVMTLNDKEKGTDNYVNRLGKDAKISALQFLQATGYPVYRLKVQLRMGQGMFDLVSKVIYPDVPFEYGPSCDASLPQFQLGRDLESFVRERHPGLAQAPAGLAPIFVHCEGSKVWTDPLTSSKRSPHQVEMALDFIADFVKSKKADPARIVPIAPYAANIQLIKSMRKRPQYASLATMQEAMTVDSFQGQENDMAVVIMGTAHPQPGPGFTSDSQRLNVMLTRQKSALVVFGDIYVGEAVERPDSKAGKKGKKGKGGKETKFLVEGVNGDVCYTKATTLRSLYKELHSSGRVVTVAVKAEGKKVEEAAPLD